MQEKTFIKNHKEQKISVLIEKPENPRGLVFIMHGLGGFKEQPHIQAFADAFKENSFTVVLFDARDTIGESEGKMEDATISSYYKDLEDVIEWSKFQSWYKDPFWLAGHSLGGICIALYAENYPEKIKALAPISTLVSGKLNWETHDPKELEEWKRTGWQESESRSKPGVIKRLK